MSLKNDTQIKQAALVLDDGAVFFGEGFGSHGIQSGELCFNTSMSGYQEVMTDPSYAKQIITFTFPHIGNVGTNAEDVESTTPAALGMVVRELPTPAANFRANSSLDDWMQKNGLIGISGIDTRALTHRLREKGSANAVIAFSETGEYNIEELKSLAANWAGLEGMDLAKEVTCAETYEWDETCWQLTSGYGKQEDPICHVAVLDYGVKRNILRNLANRGCKLTVFPASASAEEVLAIAPDGIFISNGPGDPAATGEYAVPTIKKLLASNLPTFGICLGHQMLGLAIGAKTQKMPTGHRGANHPVKNHETGIVEITSQNHGFMVDPATLPANAKITHTSLFDNSLEGIRLTDKPAFSVQYHPEASPGPQDSSYLFDNFIEMILNQKSQKGAA